MIWKIFMFIVIIAGGLFVFFYVGGSYGTVALGGSLVATVILLLFFITKRLIDSINQSPPLDIVIQRNPNVIPKHRGPKPTEPYSPQPKPTKPSKKRTRVVGEATVGGYGPVRPPKKNRR